MQYYQWTIGSTTVRNPNRLRDGLMVLKENFEGKSLNLNQQERFFDLLKEKGVYESEEENYGRMGKARKQEHARKWISVLNQLGFSFAYESSGKPVIITKAGNALLKHPDLEEEVFLRQLLKYQKPSPLPKQSGEAFSRVDILPFVASLKIVYKSGGISKEEISIFLNTTIRMRDVDSTIAPIENYRVQRSKIEGKVKRKEFYYDTQLNRLENIFAEEIAERYALIKKLVSGSKKSNGFITSADGKSLLAEITKGGKGSKTVKAKQAQLQITNAIKKGKGATTIKKIFLDYYLPLKISTLKDYADLTARYLRKSGLFSISRDKLVTVSEKEDLIKSLLSQKWQLVNGKNYLEYLWSDIQPALPSDKEDYLKKHLVLLSRKEKVLFEKVGTREALGLVSEKLPTGKNILELKQQTKSVETNLLHLKEIEFYYSQSKEDQINDILSFYNLIRDKEILGGEAYYPAYLEWNTCRVFLAIDTLANKPYEARGFRLDEELQPIHNAPGNRADMVFEYEDYVIVAEVTLSTRANQWSSEVEPVPRHIARIQVANKNKEVFGIFVAPEIDPNTVLSFFNSRKYSIENSIIELTIIPLTIDQIKIILSIFRDKRFTVKDMNRLLKALQREMTATPDAIQWHKKLPALINDWAETL